MNERCIVRVKFTPAGAGAEVRRAVGGFLRYVQHRDLHPDMLVAQEDGRLTVNRPDKRNALNQPIRERFRMAKEAVKTAVINKRAGGTGLISGRKAFQRPMSEGVGLLNAIQDVYLTKEVTIA